MSLKVRLYRVMGFLRCLHTGAAVVFPFLCVLSGKLPYCHSVNWDSVPVHGLCPQPNCEVPITVPKHSAAGGSTLIERRWRCVQHSLFSCKASPRGCPDPIDLWADLWDLLPHDAPARERMRLGLHVDSFDADSVQAHCMPSLLEPFSFLQGCSRSRRDAVCSVIAAFVFLVGASVADDPVSAVRVCALLGLCVALCLLSRCRLRPVLLDIAPSCSAPLGVLSQKPSTFRVAKAVVSTAVWSLVNTCSTIHLT
jgi:hypothetical protein